MILSDNDPHAGLIVLGAIILIIAYRWIRGKLKDRAEFSHLFPERKASDKAN